MFEARNSSGTVVATQNTVTFGLLSQGSLTLDVSSYAVAPSSSTAANNMRPYVTSSYFKGFSFGSDQLVVYQPTVEGTVVGMGFVPSGYGSVGFVGQKISTSENPAVNYWVFGRASSPRSSGIGIEIYRADGTVAFTDTAKPLKIASMTLDSTSFGASASTGTYAVTAGIPLCRAYQYEYSTSESLFFYVERAVMYSPPTSTGISGGIYNSIIGTAYNTSPLTSGDGDRGTTILVDVAGY